MKNLFLLIASAALICVCAGKKSEEKNIDQLMFQLDSTATDSGIQKMQASNSEQQINVNGKSYNLSVNRAPSDSLPKVKTETGLFCDNKIAVRIINKSNNSIIFSKTFTKRTFEEYLSDDFKNNAASCSFCFTLSGINDGGHCAGTSAGIQLMAYRKHRRNRYNVNSRYIRYNDG